MSASSPSCSLEPVPAVNEPFLREVMTWIRLHPEQWDQSHWAAEGACGTTYCLAGWAYVLGTGDRFTVESHHALIRRGGSVVDTAQRLLGLTDEQAGKLFFYLTAFEPDPDQPGHFIAHDVTFADLCHRVEVVTGVRFKPEEEQG